MKHLDILQKIFCRLEGRPINWVVTGSMGLWLQGIDIEVNDLDLQTDQGGAYQIEQALSEFRIRPVTFSTTGQIQSHFGRLRMEGLTVEIMGDIRKRNVDGGWDSPVDLSRYKRYVEIRGLRLPVLSLDYEYEAYLKLGRPEKAKIIKNWLVSQ